MDIDQFTQNLMLDRWFSNIFNEKKKFSNEKSVIISDSIKKSVEIWEENFDNRCDQWEKLRIQLINNKEWVDQFYFIKKKIYDSLINNENFIKLLNIISTEYSIDKDQFISELPGIGAWGERLLNFNSGYYTDQIVYYQKGFWVCGQYENQFILF